MIGDSNRGSMSFDPEEKHQKGAALVTAIFSIVWIGFYSFWMNSVSLNCCVERKNGVSFELCLTSPSDADVIDVSAEFRIICIVGVSFYIMILMIAMGHCIKPFRQYSRHYYGAIWVFF